MSDFMFIRKISTRVICVNVVRSHLLFAVLHLVLGHLSGYGFHVKLHRRRRHYHQPFKIYTGTQVQANRGQNHTLPGRT